MNELSNHLQTVPAFTTLTIYQDEAARHEVERLLARLSRDVLKHLDLQASWVSLDQLAVETQARYIAALNAKQAELIIFSVGSSAQLPEEVQAWMESWVPEKRHDGSALVLLTAPEGGNARPDRSPYAFLEEAAQRGNMTFLVRKSETEHQDAEAELEPAGVWSEPPMPVISDTAIVPWPGGLNE